MKDKNKEQVTVYLSGKITGDRFYKIKFKWYELKWRRLGFKVFNPCVIPSVFKDYESYIRIDLSALSQCDAIVMLKDWRFSNGATIEHGYAIEHGIPVVYS